MLTSTSVLYIFFLFFWCGYTQFFVCLFVPLCCSSFLSGFQNSLRDVFVCWKLCNYYLCEKTEARVSYITFLVITLHVVFLSEALGPLKSSGGCWHNSFPWRHRTNGTCFFQSSEEDFYNHKREIRLLLKVLLNWVRTILKHFWLN